MRIKFTDEAKRVAEVWRGWFRKKYTEVYQDSYESVWCFTDTRTRVPETLDHKLDKAQIRAHWRAPAVLPTARLVKPRCLPGECHCEMTGLGCPHRQL